MCKLLLILFIFIMFILYLFCFCLLVIYFCCEDDSMVLIGLICFRNTLPTLCITNVLAMKELDSWTKLLSLLRIFWRMSLFLRWDLIYWANYSTAFKWLILLLIIFTFLICLWKSMSGQHEIYVLLFNYFPWIY